MIFSDDQSTTYITTYHAKERTYRLNKSISSHELERIVQEGKVILDTKAHRYIQSGDYRFPCVKDDGKYIIKSIISKDMYMTAQE